MCVTPQVEKSVWKGQMTDGTKLNEQRKGTDVSSDGFGKTFSKLETTDPI